eukprot:scaffold295521_cov30-Tisochrysis_lutea.AAC.1
MARRRQASSCPLAPPGDSRRLAHGVTEAGSGIWALAFPAPPSPVLLSSRAPLPPCCTCLPGDRGGGQGQGL